MSRVAQVSWNKKAVLDLAQQRASDTLGVVAQVVADQVKRSAQGAGLRDTGFMTDNIVAVPPGGSGFPAKTEIREGKLREAEAVPGTDKDTAIVASAATYTMHLEVRYGFIWSTILRIASDSNLLSGKIQQF